MKIVNGKIVPEDTVDEWIALMPNQLDDIGVGLAKLLDIGRKVYGLQGPELVDFVRHCLHALVERGAKPRHWRSLSHPNRNFPLHYGSDTNEEIVEGVITEWLALGDREVEWGDFWFDLPEFRQLEYIGEWYERPDGLVFGVRMSDRYGLLIEIIRSTNPLLIVGWCQMRN